MPARERTTSNGRREDRGVVPILEARPGGAAQRFAASMEGRHPAAVFFAAVLADSVTEQRGKEADVVTQRFWGWPLPAARCVGRAGCHDG